MIAPIRGFTALTFITDVLTISASPTSLKYAISNDTTTENSIVSIDGIVQEPIASYSIDGAEITFTEVPPANSKVIVKYIRS